MDQAERTVLGRRLWSLLAATGASNADIAAALGRKPDTVKRWRTAGAVSKPGTYEQLIPSVIETLGRASEITLIHDLRAELHRTIASATSLLRRVQTLTPEEAVSGVIAALTRAHRDVRLSVAPAYRGTPDFGMDEPLHYFVGVDVLLGPPPMDAAMTQAEVVPLVTDALRNEWRELGVHLRLARAPEWGLNKQPAAVIQVPILERPRPVPSAAPVAVPGLGRRLLILAPVYGYGELLAALLAEALGFGLADLRYRDNAPRTQDTDPQRAGMSPSKTAREARFRRAEVLLGADSLDMAWCIAGEKLLDDLTRSIATRATETTVIAVAYGRKWAKRGQDIHATPTKNQARNSRTALAVAQRVARLQKSPAVTVAVDYSDDDVVATPNANQADTDLIVNHTVLTAIAILDQLDVPEDAWRDGVLRTAKAKGRLDHLRSVSSMRKSTVTIIRR